MYTNRSIFFKLLFDQRIIDVVLAETNHFCTNCTASTPIPGWVHMTEREFMAFLGIMIGASVSNIRRLEDIWNPDWTRGIPNYARIMPKARFFQMKSNLHFNDNCQTPNRDHPSFKLHKIQPIISLCTENFRANYNLHQEVAVDESITRFKGRNSMKQFDPSKPIKRGFKWWTLADSHSGYVYDMKLYTGRDVEKEKKTKGPTDSKAPCVPVVVVGQSTIDLEVVDPPNVEAAEETTIEAEVVASESDDEATIDPEVADALGTRAVLSVVSPHLDHKNHVIFCDRFFSSIPLMEKLSKIGIFACGTIQKNRIGIPDCIKDANLVKGLKRGDSHYIVEKDIRVQLLLWQDRKPIHFANTFYPCEGNNSVRRKITHGGGAVIQIPCPPAVLAYNKYMNGVDRADQIRQSYCIDRRSKRWPMRLFWHCLDTCIANAYILYTNYLSAKGHAKKNIPDQLDFRSALIKTLIGNFTSRKRLGRCSLNPPPQPRLDVNQHKIVDMRLHGVPMRKRCIVCLKRKQRRESFFGCARCNVSLCQPVRSDCFEVYHTKLHIE